MVNEKVTIEIIREDENHDYYSHLEVQFHFFKRKFVTRIFPRFYYSILKFIVWANFIQIYEELNFLLFNY